MAEDKILYQMPLVVYQWERAQNCTILTTETAATERKGKDVERAPPGTEDLPKTELGQDSRKVI